jgi:hypothetical protein
MKVVETLDSGGVEEKCRLSLSGLLSALSRRRGNGRTGNLKHGTTYTTENAGSSKEGEKQQ